MAAIDYFVSVPGREVVGDDMNNGNLDSGTTSTATDFIELRMRVQDPSNNPTNVSKRDVLIALDIFKRWIIEGGLIRDGTNVPIL